MTAPVDLSPDIGELTPRVIALRRALHQHPELAFEEAWTASTLAARMRALGLAVQERIGGTGVLAVLDGMQSGKTLLIRADMDALPMADATGREYASTRAGRHHGCGHDVHCAVVAGVAEVLARHRDRIAGRIGFVFQPADEPMRGARAMIDDGLLTRLTPDMFLSLHVVPMLDVGHAVIQRGPIWASWDTQVLTIKGAPKAFDLARVAAEVTTSLYDLVDESARQSTDEIAFRVRALKAEQRGAGDTSQAAIEVHLGRGEPSEASIEINLALYDNTLRIRLLRAVADTAETIVAAAGGALTRAVDYAIPAVINDGRVTDAVERAAQRVIGPAHIVTGWRNRFADDVALFMAATPGCLMLLGTANATKGITETWHRPAFDVDEDALPIGVHVLSQAALDLLHAPAPTTPAISPAGPAARTSA